MNCQLCILTWERDLNWLNASLRSVEKYWKAEPPLIIATPECKAIMPAVVKELGCRVIYEPKRSDGRLGQQYIKMTSDKYVTSDSILHTDSDCLFTRECSPEDFTYDGKPVVVMESYDDILPSAIEPDRICLTGYREASRLLMGIYPQYEYMRRHPFHYYSSSIRNMRKLIESRSGTPLLDLMQSFPNSGQISEFNFMGAYCDHFEHDRYHWIEAKNAPPPLIRQFHSWSQDPNTQENFYEWKTRAVPHWKVLGVVGDVTAILQ